MTTKHVDLIKQELDYIYSTDFKHIGVKVESNWGCASLHVYFASVLSKNRPNRTGLPIEVYKTVVSLYLVHLDSFGNFGYPHLLDDPNVDLRGSET